MGWKLYNIYFKMLKNNYMSPLRGFFLIKSNFFLEHSTPNGAIFASEKQFVLRKKRQKQFLSPVRVTYFR
jgi:hypothetical protein